MEEEEDRSHTHGEDGLLGTLVETVGQLKALRSLGEAVVERGRQRGGQGGQGGQDGGGGKGGGEEEEEEQAGGGGPDDEECIRKAMHVLREVSVSHWDGVSSWREALRECACILATPPPGGSNQPPAPAGESGPVWSGRHEDGFSDVLLSIEEDVQYLEDKLAAIIAKLNEPRQEAWNGQTGPSSEQLEDEGHLREQDQLGLEPTSQETPCPPDVQPAAEPSSKPEETEESVVDGNDGDAAPQDLQRDNLEDKQEKMKDGGLITVG